MLQERTVQGMTGGCGCKAMGAVASSVQARNLSSAVLQTDEGLPVWAYALGAITVIGLGYYTYKAVKK
jgi:hypothetical protein